MTEGELDERREMRKASEAALSCEEQSVSFP